MLKIDKFEDQKGQGPLRSDGGVAAEDGGKSGVGTVMG